MAIRRGWKLIVYPGASEDGADGPLLPIVIRDFELALFAIEVGPLPLYNSQCVRVEGANPNTIEDLGTDESQQAVRHVIRRTTGKCRDQNPLGWDALGEEPCDAPDKHRGLSRPGSRKDERCPGIKPKCRFLTRV